MVKLAYKFYQKSEVLDGHKDSNSETKNSEIQFIILHGLFGSSKNWVTISKFLTNYGNVYSLDLRNHGDSPHTDLHSIESMAYDLDAFIEDHNLKHVILLGHSMGGLVSMYFDLTRKGRLKHLIIQDIAPRDYPFIYENEIASMSFPLDSFKSRQEIDRKMQEYVPDAFIRQFLQMNLDRTEEGIYKWKLNVQLIGKGRQLFENLFLDLEPSSTKTTFLIGGSSEYIKETDYQLIRNLFNDHQIYVIEGGGHYIHFTHQNKYIELLESILAMIV